jgi:glutaredoxin
MRAKVYTLPSCTKCVYVKDYFKEKNFEFQEIELGNDEGVKDLRSYYKHIKEVVPRMNDGALMLPIVIFFEGEEVKQVCHTLEQVKEIV